VAAQDGYRGFACTDDKLQCIISTEVFAPAQKPNQPYKPSGLGFAGNGRRANEEGNTVGAMIADFKERAGRDGSYDWSKLQLLWQHLVDCCTNSAGITFTPAAR